MLEQEKNYLISILSIIPKVTENDSTVLTDIQVLNGVRANDADVDNKVNDIMLKLLEDIKPTNRDLFVQVITASDAIVDKQFYTKMADLTVLNDAQAIKTCISNIFKETLVFVNPTNEYNFYKYLSMKAINTNDSTLLKACVEKLSKL